MPAVRAPGAAVVTSEASQPRRSLDRAETASTVAETATLADPVHDETRFLFEDADRSGSTMSRSALQRDSRRRAYQVIRQSQAWSNLLDKWFPDAIRLSIHQRPCANKKIGIHLMDCTDDDQWLTPWHSVVVETPDGYRLMKPPSGCSAQCATSSP
ncbi:L-tyrosine/L-tryptophan isonitrile synthase family protein [Nocardia sp. NPDC049737]|uniref:L-tyrosine/L-tryptophan isonitrile synthase family protein n=1 Tax=Nocardia sp. NPDC049737 TaxID=3154358 RepID=UPI003447D4C4